MKSIFSRKKIKASINKQHDLYVNNLVGDVKANPRDFYRQINSQKKDRQGILPLKKKGGNGVTEFDSEKAAELNGQLKGAFNKKTEYLKDSNLVRSLPLSVFLILA